MPSKANANFNHFVSSSLVRLLDASTPSVKRCACGNSINTGYGYTVCKECL